jgi:hypothetical protein
LTTYEEKTTSAPSLLVRLNSHTVQVSTGEWYKIWNSRNPQQLYQP